MADQDTLLWKIAACYTRDSSLCDRNKATVLGAIRARSLKTIAEASYSFPEALQPGEDVVLRQLAAFFKKNASYSDEATCSDAAVKSFHRAERICRITNKRLDYYYGQRGRLDPDLSLWLSRMEKSVRQTLGPLRDFLDELPKLVRVTGGATEDRPRRRALPFLKISRKVKAPRSAYPLISSYVAHLGYTEGIRFIGCETNRVEFVPKNYKTHRSIACEPTGSLPFQLAVDAWIKRRLLRHGIDLRDQKRNQEMARIGSITGEYATIDLSMASDTLSINCVAWLCPEDWFVFLDALRSKGYGGSAGSGQYSKFSSMGNGFTFTLETLIFHAACLAVGDREASVYGDDIIVKTEYAHNLIRLLRFLGFHVNEEKSFLDGPFRESCGADWMRGVNVTPFYIRKNPRSRAELSHLVNGLVRIGKPYGELWTLAKTLAQDEHLATIPHIEDTMAGVHVDTHSAYQARKLFVRHSMLFFRGYKASGATRTNAGWRSYFLWRNFTREKVANSWIAELKRSSLDATTWAVGAVRYRKALCHYAPPTVATPLYLYAWSDFLQG